MVGGWLVRKVDPIRRGLRQPHPFFALLGLAEAVRKVDPIRRGLRLWQYQANLYNVPFVRKVDPIRRGLRQNNIIFV